MNRIKFTNFKSFKSVDLELQDYNVLIGPNAAGKSNFVQFFQFLSDLSKETLENAISLQGGHDYFTNYRLDDEEITIELNINANKSINVDGLLSALTPEFEGKSIHKQEFEIDHYLYHSRIICTNNIKSFTHDQVNIHLQNDGIKGVIEIRIKNREDIEVDKTGKLFDNTDENDDISDRVFLEYLFGGILGDILPKLGYLDKFRSSKYFELFTLNPFLSGIKIFDFNVKEAKSPVSIKGRKDLEPDGSNLAIVLRSIFKHETKREEFKILLRQCLQFIHDIKFEEEQLGKTVSFSILEEYDTGKNIPSMMISDGTINIMAIIVALFFEEGDFIILEEPEQYIHPNLMSKFMELVKEASKTKQILITTHNPELLRYTEIDKILVAKRDKQGHSIIESVRDREDLSFYLQEEIGIEDLFIDNRL